MKGQTYRGRSLVEGVASGELLVSKRAFTFAHGVDPETGRVSDVHSDVVGSNVKGRVLVYPHGKGSTTASSWFLETVRCGNAPAAIITESTDLSAVIGAVLSREVYGKTVPVISSLPAEFYSSARSGAVVNLTKEGTVTVEP
jgi:predicted aconitase with swiveling domain